MLGFELTFWDYLTFVVLFLGLGVFVAVVVFVLGLPGRNAIARRHPELDAVNIMGWVGFMAAEGYSGDGDWPVRSRLVACRNFASGWIGDFVW